MKYSILQINREKEGYRKYAFMRYEFALKHDFDINDYSLIYEGEINITESIENILEYLFMKFNTKLPEGYKGHSLSVSDIIELNGVKYYVDDIGFKNIGD